MASYCHRRYVSRLFQHFGKLQPKSKAKRKDGELGLSCKSHMLALYNDIIAPSHSGGFHLLPLGLRALEKLTKLVDYEMQAIGGQKVSLTTLAPESHWQKSGRWHAMGSDLFTLKDRHDHGYCLSPTHEELITHLVASLSQLSYKQLPIRLYQITRKFRDERAPKYGLLRGREFEMKDMYSFDTCEDTAMETYTDVCQAYNRIFDQIGVDYVKVSADPGLIGGDKSHEYHYLVDVGQDSLLICQRCGIEINKELEEKVDWKSNCLLTPVECECVEKKGIEVGHTFFLGAKYSSVFKALYRNSDGNKQINCSMGCFGLGLTRILQSSIECLSTDTSIRWPSLLAPYQICIIPKKDGVKGDAFLKAGEDLSDKLVTLSNLRGEVVIDDRMSLTIGKRQFHGDQLGYPYQIVLGAKLGVINAFDVTKDDVSNGISESVLSFDDLEEDEKDTVKRKTRNLSEKKRRDQFNVLINELCSMVASNNKKLDKSSVLKSAIQFLRNHQEFSAQSAANEIKEDWKPTFLCNEEFTQLMLEAVDSFLVVFTQQGKVLFTSDSVTSLLGHLPSDLINHSLYDLMHEDDRLKVFDLLSKQSQVSESSSISFTCHLRRGNIDPKESATYEYVRVYGTSQVVSELEEETLIADNTDFIGIDLPEQSLCFCCTVRLLTSHIIREMSTVDETTCEFTSRHSLEWKFLFLDHRAPPIIGYLPFEVLGTSGYDYYHPDDLEAVSKCHEQLMVMGKGTSSFYRFLTKGQQWIWLQTRYFITYHQWNSKPEFIVCTNTVVNYCDVRRQLRQEMGYQEGDSGNSVSATNSSNSSMGLPSNSKETRSTQEGQVTSYGHSEGMGFMRGSIVQSPDIASSQHPDCDRVQLPHSTKQENGSRKHHVSSQLQSLLQLHLQRSSSSLSTSSVSSSSHSKLISSGTSNTATIVASASAGGPTRKSSISQTQVRTSGSSQSSLPSGGQTSGPNRPVPNLIPIMTALPTSWTPQAALTSHAQSPLVSQTVDISSPQPTSSIANQQPTYQSGLVLTAAQQLLHEQLIQKSEQLQDAIQKQQEELRLIKEQLAYGAGMVQQPQPQQQPSQAPHHKQHQQYILQQRLGVQAHSMVLSPSAPRHQLAIMSSNPSEIFLSPISNVNMDMAQTQHQEQTVPQIHQKQQHQQQQPVQLPHGHQQHQVPLYPNHPIVLQQDTGVTGQHMVLSPNSPVHQLAMMTPNASQIFLSPIANISMDIPQQQQQPLQQVQSQQLQQQHQTQALQFPPGASCSSSEPNSTNVDLSDSC